MDTPRAATTTQLVLIVAGTFAFFFAASRSDVWSPSFISVAKELPFVADDFGQNNKVEVHYPTARQRCLYKAQVDELGFFDVWGPESKVTPDQFAAAHPELCNEVK